MKKNTHFQKSFAILAAVVLAVPTLGLASSVLTGSLNSNTRDAQAYGNATQITNTATVSSPTLDSDTNNNTAVAKDKLCGKADFAILSFTDGLTGINASTATTYTATMKNNGPSPIEAFTMTYSYDNTFVNGLTPATTGGTISTVSTTSAGTIETVVIKVTPTGTLLNTASIVVTLAGNVLPNAVNGTAYTVSLDVQPTEKSYDDCVFLDDVQGNNTGNDVTTMSTVADLAITKISSGGGNSTTNAIGTIYAGSTVAYTLGVVNNGPSTAAANITVVDTMPSQVTPIIASGANYTASLDWTCTFVSPTMTCINTNPMLNGASSSVVINSNVTSTL